MSQTHSVCQTAANQKLDSIQFRTVQLAFGTIRCVTSNAANGEAHAGTVSMPNMRTLEPGGAEAAWSTSQPKRTPE